jgi:hypothetical protein
VIPTTIRRHQGHGRAAPFRFRRLAHCCISRTGYGCAAMPAVTAWPSRLCLSSFAGAPMHRRTFCHTGAVHRVRTTWGELAASELG